MCQWSIAGQTRCPARRRFRLGSRPRPGWKARDVDRQTAGARPIRKHGWGRGVAKYEAAGLRNSAIRVRDGRSGVRRPALAACRGRGPRFGHPVRVLQLTPADLTARAISTPHLQVGLDPSRSRGLPGPVTVTARARVAGLTPSAQCPPSGCRLLVGRW
jgi:hypothetical protein